MSSQLRFDGFYDSGSRNWEDWHAGVRMHGVRFHYRRFYANSHWLGCYRDHDFDFWGFTESITPDMFADALLDRAPRIADADPLCRAGRYTIAGDILTEVLAPDWTGGMIWNSTYRIREDRLLAESSDGRESALLFRPGH